MAAIRIPVNTAPSLSLGASASSMIAPSGSSARTDLEPEISPSTGPLTAMPASRNVVTVESRSAIDTEASAFGRNFGIVAHSRRESELPYIEPLGGVQRFAVEIDVQETPREVFRTHYNTTELILNSMISSSLKPNSASSAS